MNPFRKLWNRITGYGPCALCHKEGPLSWLKESYKDPKSDISWAFEGYLCGDCYRAKVDRMRALLDSLEKTTYGV